MTPAPSSPGGREPERRPSGLARSPRPRLCVPTVPTVPTAAPKAARSDPKAARSDASRAVSTSRPDTLTNIVPYHILI
jgi:hypothetical protein